MHYQKNSFNDPRWAISHLDIIYGAGTNNYFQPILVPEARYFIKK